MIKFFKKNFTPAEVYNVLINFEKRISLFYNFYNFFVSFMYVTFYFTNFFKDSCFMFDLSNMTCEKLIIY